MKEFAERKLDEAKGVYLGAFLESRDAQGDEALALGVDQSTASNYLKTSVDRHLPFGLAALSIYKDTLASWLAEQCKGIFIKIGDHHTEDVRTALKKILECTAKAVAEEDQKKIVTLLHSISAHAERAAKKGETK